MDDKRSLDGRTVVITGASRGIGRGIARTFSAVGASVVLFARGQPGLDAVAGELPPDRTIAVAGDVTMPTTSDARSKRRASASGGSTCSATAPASIR